jgi:CheY-like chemotaxis protein
MEGFGREDAGEILGHTVDEIDALVADAVRELMAQPPTTVLIIEDEPVISLDLASIVADLGHSVVGTAATSGEAVALARATRPGFVLADIQLADGSSGIDAVHEILSAMDVPVIFITAYPERLLTGERPEPTFLVTKPFIADSVKSTIGHALLLAAEARSRAA